MQEETADLFSDSAQRVRLTDKGKGAKDQRSTVNDQGPTINDRQLQLFFSRSAKAPVLTTARPTVPRPISCFSSRAVTRSV
jgi:hypothetical protein